MNLMTAVLLGDGYGLVVCHGKPLAVQSLVSETLVNVFLDCPSVAGRDRGADVEAMRRASLDLSYACL